MADEQKKTKKEPVKKAEKKPAKKAAAKKEPATKKAAAKKDSKAKGKAKKPAAKKSAKTKKEPAKKAEAKDTKGPAKKAAARPKAPAAPPVVKASARYVRVAPRKARLIADQVRGMHIESARALLQFSPRGAAHPIHKLIDSAAANAENNHDLIGDEMRIASITVDEGPTLRRFRPRAMGRATPINKRTSHIRVALTPVED
ncbi:MAG: 50S ribosomal protein L22 [Solirubrobacterales bacterium]